MGAHLHGVNRASSLGANLPDIAWRVIYCVAPIWHATVRISRQGMLVITLIQCWGCMDAQITAERCNAKSGSQSCSGGRVFFFMVHGTRISFRCHSAVALAPHLHSFP